MKTRSKNSDRIAAPPPMTRSGPDIHCFRQLPADEAPRQAELTPHAQFHFFTAGIILQNKVFIR